MPHSPSTFTIEQAEGALPDGYVIWVAYGTYASLTEAKGIAGKRPFPCRIIAARVIWTSIGAPLSPLF